GLRRRTTLMLFQARLASSMDLRTLSISETLALVDAALGDASSYMQTIVPCPGDCRMGTPIIAWASAALNFEQGSMTATGDSGWTLLLDADAGVGELGPALLEGDPLHEHNRQESHTAMNATMTVRTRFILPPGRIADSKSDEALDFLPFL